jgi:hypothetical protein
MAHWDSPNIAQQQEGPIQIVKFNMPQSPGIQRLQETPIQSPTPTVHQILNISGKGRAQYVQLLNSENQGIEPPNTSFKTPIKGGHSPRKRGS